MSFFLSPLMLKFGMGHEPDQPLKCRGKRCVALMAIMCTPSKRPTRDRSTATRHLHFRLIPATEVHDHFCCTDTPWDIGSHEFGHLHCGAPECRQGLYLNGRTAFMRPELLMIIDACLKNCSPALTFTSIGRWAPSGSPPRDACPDGIGRPIHLFRPYLAAVQSLTMHTCTERVETGLASF